MLENQYNAQHLSQNTSWTIGDFKEKEKQRVIRKFINSAIYVEKEITEMAPQRKTSPLCNNDESSDNDTLKKCSCAAIGTCSCNNSSNKNIISEVCFAKGQTRKCFSNSALQLSNSVENKKPFYQEILKSSSFQKTPESGYRTVEQSSNSSNEQSENSFSSGTTVKAAELEPNGNFTSELRLSLTCLNTNRTCTLDPKEKQEIVQNWMAKKELEKKRKALQEAKIVKQKEEERQRLIEKERENFRKWLAEKKKAEERKKAQKELEAEEQKLKQVEKEKKKVENDISFNLWLRKKRKTDLERRITEKLALLHLYEEKQRRMEENEKAYQEWLDNSKNKQKPLPMNKGLQSLCSSASVTYINPIPWNPNIELKFKPASQ